MVDETVGVGDNMGTMDPDKIIQTIAFKETLEGMEDKLIEKNTEIIAAMNITEVGISQREWTFSRSYSNNRGRSSSGSRSRSGS